MDAPASDTAFWRRLGEPGLEWCRLEERLDEGGWSLEGTVLVFLQGTPFRISYRVETDDHWQSREAVVRTQADEDERALVLRASSPGRWTVGEGGEPHGLREDVLTERGDLQGCADVDLGFTPSTNTLPIRRLGLHVGQSADVDAAWVRFPELTVSRLRQRYTRLGESGYRYESLDSGFAAELDIDAAGLVNRYAGGWERLEPGTS